MYCEINFKSKKELKLAVESGKQLGVFSPGPFPAPTQGTCCLEGPHYPQPHRWYATATLVNGIITKVK